jgi:hypothetical protein
MTWPWTSSPSRWWAIAGAIPVIWFYIAYNASDGFRTQFETVTSVRGQRFIDAHTINVGLLYDLGFIASWLVIVGLLYIGRHWLPPFRSRLWYKWAWLAAAGALALDVLEDGALLVALHWRPSGWLVVLATIGWVKVLAYVVALAGAVVVIVGATIGREATRLA